VKNTSAALKKLVVWQSMRELGVGKEEKVNGELGVEPVERAVGFASHPNNEPRDRYAL
jgi:hypothetical protein